MKLLHMKYAVEVARMGSINKAADELFVAQSNLSRCIRDLESDLGINIFDRNSKGMILTPDGETFINYAQKILDQIDDIENMYKKQFVEKERFLISVPRASYISDAFARFTRNLGYIPGEIYYVETNPSVTISNILNYGYELGIVRFPIKYDRYYKKLFEEKELVSEVLVKYKPVLIMSKESPIAGKDKIFYEDLVDLIEIVHGDPYVPSLPVTVVKKEVLPDSVDRRVVLYERASQFELLSEHPETFMWVSPIPTKTLERFDLVQRECTEDVKENEDVLIYRKDYQLNKYDIRFIDEVNASIRQHFKRTE